MDRLGFKGAGMEPVKPPGDARRLARSDRIPLKARGPNDVWLLDLTQVKGLFGLQSFRIAASSTRSPASRSRSASSAASPRPMTWQDLPPGVATATGRRQPVRDERSVRDPP